MAENSRNSKLSSKDDECTFSWKLFTGWDFMIGHAETSHNRIASVVVGFKEALLEEAEKKKDKRKYFPHLFIFCAFNLWEMQFSLLFFYTLSSIFLYMGKLKKKNNGALLLGGFSWRIILQRILVNILVMTLLAASGYTVVALVNKSEELARQDNWISRNAVNVTMTLLSFFLPMIFEAIGLFENWHPRQQLRLQLARIMILNLLNLYSLMFSFIYKINSKEQPLSDLKIKNDTAAMELAKLTQFWQAFTSMTTITPNEISLSTEDFSATTPTTITTDTITDAVITTTAAAMMKVRCYNITVKCSKPWRVTTNLPSTTTVAAATTLLLLNLTTTMMPTTMITEETESSTWTPTTTTIELSTPLNTELSTMPTTPTITTTFQPTTQFATETYYDYEDTSIITTEEENLLSSSASTLFSSTTTENPGNDSQFAYYDYFAGFDINDQNLVDSNEIEEFDKRSKRELNFDYLELTQENNDFKTSQEIKGDKVQTEPLKAKGPDPISLQLLRSSKYGRRDRHTTTTVTHPAPLTISSSPIFSSLYKSTIPILYDFTTGTYWPSTFSTTPIETDTTIEDKGLLWERNELLQKVAEFFITSTLKPISDETTTTTTTSTSPTALEAVPITTILPKQQKDELIESKINADFDLPDVFSTQYYIANQDIGQTSFYDWKEIDDGNFETCIRTVCDDDFTTISSSTDLDATTMATITTTELTIYQQYIKNLTNIKKTFKEIELNLTTMCWETSLGQELSKVIVFDGIMSIVAPLCIDFLRALFVRYVNQKWCWDMEKTFPQYGDFKIAENILTLINNQGQVWMGIFFSPGLVLINLVKLVIMMYFRSWIVLTCNVPHEVVFKASKSNNFYLSLLLTMLFLCVLPVGYAIVWLRPSWHCGPFSDYNRISEFITNTTRDALPKQLHDPLNYLTSSSTVIPLLLLLILIIYYLVSLTGALREANQDLRTQLQKEREEERKKFFKLPESKPVENTSASLTNRWRKVLEASSPVTPLQTPDFESEEYKSQARKELISRIMKKALRKSSGSDEDSAMRQGDDDTDTEHHDSLPHDEEGKEKHFGLSKLQQIRKTRKPSLVDIVNIAKSEMEKERSSQQQFSIKRKETHPRGRFRVEKIERKEDKEKHDVDEKYKSKESGKVKNKDSPDKTYDPEINTRIINERRQSLLRKHNETEIKAKEKEKEREAEKSKEKQKDNDREKEVKVPDVKEKDKLKEQDKEKDKDRDRPFSPSEYKRRIYESIKKRKRHDKLPADGLSSQDKTKDSAGEADNTSALPKPKNSEKRLSFRRRNKSPVVKENEHDEKSSFQVVDEKNSNSSPEENTSLPAMEHFHNLSGKFKFRRHKNKLISEPEIFKFEPETIKSDQISTIATTPTGYQSDTELQSPNLNEELATPNSLHHLNLGADKFASLSRQSKKKIGSFLALVKDAVNNKMFDQEQQNDDLTTQVPQTTIDIPSTPERELPSSASNVTFTLPSVTSASTVASIQPYIMPKAPLEIPEDLELPSYQNYMASGTANTMAEEIDQAGPIIFPQRSISQRRRPQERPITTRQDSTTSIWSDNIPTITISSSPDGENLTSKQNTNEPSTPTPLVKIIKINIENDK